MQNISEKQKLERDLFILEMKDSWDSVDYAEAERLRQRIRELEEDERKNI